MDARNLAPTIRPIPPLTPERPITAAPRHPALSGGVQSFVTDPNLKHTNSHHVPGLKHSDHIPGLKHTDHVPHADHMAHSDGKYAAPIVPLTKRGPMAKADRGQFLSTDDGALSKQIMATHAPDLDDLNVKPILFIVEDILQIAKPKTTVEATLRDTTPLHADKLDDKALHRTSHDNRAYHHDDRVYDTEQDSEIVKVLTYPINKMSSEIICKCAGGGESHAVTMELLKSLSSYSWDAKAVIVFAAFAINYGEFWLVENYHTSDPLAKNIATLKDLPDIMAHAGELKKQFDAVLDLLTAVLRVTHCIIEFKELPSMYISRESPEITAATAHIPTAVYWIIRSILVCTFTLLNLIGSGREFITSTTESWEILSMAHKLQVILEHLQTQLRICKGLVDKKKEEDAYHAFVRLIESAHIDNMKVLRAIIHSREDQRPLYDGTKRINERLEVLRLKYVLLLITDLNIPLEELNVLHLIYNQHQVKQEYEVLWLPIVDRHSGSLHDPVFYDLRNNSMPWLSVDHHSLVEPVAIRYIKEAWKFTHTPMLVVLDPHGRPSNLDALPMMWIWGSAAFPFTKSREASLWSESVWNIELLADSIDPRIPEWIRENKVICVYGGEDIDWIRKFTLTARSVARELQVPLEMLYVGKRNPKDKVRRCHEIIDREKLSHVFSVAEYYDYVWYFWVRLWSMWNSKRQIGMTVDEDRIMQEIMDVLAYDSSEHGWAVFSRANHDITKGNGEKVLSVFENYQNWGHMVDHPEKFVPVLDEQLQGVKAEHHCNRLILPGHAGYIPESVVCSECGKTMDKYVMYRCCTD